jgi:hypothetical protein
MARTDSFLADKLVICVQVSLLVEVRLIAEGVTVSVGKTCVGQQSSSAASACRCSVARRARQAGLAVYDLQVAVLADGRPYWTHGMQRMTLVGRTRDAFGAADSYVELLIIVGWVVFC